MKNPLRKRYRVEVQLDAEADVWYKGATFWRLKSAKWHEQRVNALAYRLHQTIYKSRIVEL